MDQIKDLWSRFVLWLQSNPLIAAGIGLVIILLTIFGMKRAKLKAKRRRSAAKARRAKKFKHRKRGRR